MHLREYYAEISNRVLLTYNEEQAFMMEAEHAQKLSNVSDLHLKVLERLCACVPGACWVREEETRD